MKLGTYIKEYRDKHKLSMDTFASMTGLSKSYISVLERDYNPTTGRSVSPTIPVIKKIADATNVSFDYIMEILDDDYEVTVNTQQSDKKISIYNKFKLYENPVSAGQGLWLDEGTEYNYIEIEHQEINADFALKVRGDSMSPMYNDGDVVFVKSRTLLEPGQVGVFLINGEGYLKQWQGNMLISLNREYDPIYVEENDEFLIVGKVVEKLSK